MRLTLTHRNHPFSRSDGCPEGHLAPIGFDTTDPVWEEGEHGESNHPDAVPEQCMCGHPMYLHCPDYIAVWQPNPECAQGKHGNCDHASLNDYTGDIEEGMCPCDCHIEDVPGGAA